jgi:hypothetical protein
MEPASRDQRREGNLLFYIFLAVMALVLVATVIALIVFGPPEITVPGGPEE